MREVKFKVRNKDTGEWLSKEGADFWTILSLFSNHQNGSSGNWEYYEYTGLKDKNGKEVYEGDIFKNDITNPEQIVVEWSVQSHWVGLADGYKVKSIGFHFDEYYFNFDEGEVVGNIYENPELINNHS